jgi:hypothetical protein
MTPGFVAELADEVYILLMFLVPSNALLAGEEKLVENLNCGEAHKIDENL